ncbi:MAG TPA: DUF3108 domain-containing protein [Xanthobacteraceae bacterium]|jgi:hypothetical protein|nr:DUF3108 domain-containing protein [Xanthobacteraceae bacterium]
MLNEAARKVAPVLLFLASTATALADARLKVNYEGSVTAIPVGRGEFVLDIADGGYAVVGSARVAGIAKLVSRGHGTVSAKGTFIDGYPSPSAYMTNSESEKKKEDIRISFANAAVSSFSVVPPTEPSKDRIPLTENDRTGVVDPMTAAIVSVPGTGDLLSPDNCKRTIPIFDGRQRYDLVFSYERTDNAKDIKGYNGKLLVCRVDYRPIAGHKPDRLQVKYMQDNKNIFVWLAPVAGTRVLFPARVSIVTLIGIVVVQAEHFEVSPREASIKNTDTK